MNCSEVRPLLEAHADGELDLVRQVELEAHLQDCPACAAQAEALRARRDALRQSLPRFGAPAELRRDVLAMARAGCAGCIGAPGRPQGLGHLAYLGGIAAAVAACLFAGYAWGTSRARSGALLDEAVADHVRSLQAGHLMDVVSTDQHTVKPWFAGKLDFSPPVVDLASGFPLAGGRLEQIDGRPAAALVFHRHLHTVNLFVWPASGAVPPHGGAEKGYNAQGWSQGGMNFLAVSEIPASDLAQFTAAYRARLGPDPSRFQERKPK